LLVRYILCFVASMHNKSPKVILPAFHDQVAKRFFVPRSVALFFAYFFLALAIIGVAVPGLPTVPFLLLAAWFSARGSERLHQWLYRHPRLGKLLIDWETQNAVSRKSKVIAVIMLLVSWLVMYQRIGFGWILVGITFLFITVAAYLISRREPQ
jgi:uncharacterized membrane protein YbaN (DUF454 family)